MQSFHFEPASPETPPQFMQTPTHHLSFSQEFFGDYSRIISTAMASQTKKEGDNNPEQSTRTNCSTSKGNPNSPQANRRRRKSFIDLQQSHKSKIFKMIRDEFKTAEHENGFQKEEETTVCSSLAYLRSEKGWKNRELVTLTSLKMYKVPIENLRKIKILREEPLIGCRSLRFHTENQKWELAICKNDIRKWFTNIIWTFLAAKGYNLSLQTMWKEEREQFADYYYKRSEILGRWERRYAKISEPLGFQSSRGPECGVSLTMRETTELWTRFQIVSLDGEEWLVFKMWFHFLKEQIAVKVKQASKWANYLSSLLR